MRSYISVWSCSIWFSVCCFPLVLCPVDPSSHWPPLNKQNPIPITSTKMHALKWLNFTKSLWFGKKRPLTTICHCSWESTFPKCVNAPSPTHEKYIEYQTLYVRHILNVRHICFFYNLTKYVKVTGEVWRLVTFLRVSQNTSEPNLYSQIQAHLFMPLFNITNKISKQTKVSTFIRKNIESQVIFWSRS